MADGFYKDVTRALKDAGFKRISGGKGSHEKWEGPDGLRTLVPRKMKSRHTANGILEDVGLDKIF